jgi:Reverse transcriptase (RNA-dependent DNA polymerase)
MIFISFYIDDYLITGSDKQGIQEIKDAMAKRFKIKNIGACVRYLGMEIKRNEEARTIHLAQTKYTTQLLKDTGMWDIKTEPTPIEPGQELEPVKTTALVRQEDFRKLVGKIQ